MLPQDHGLRYQELWAETSQDAGNKIQALALEGEERKHLL